DFIALEGFDAFSFGREAGAGPGAGLKFAKLAIDMSFDQNDHSQPSGRPKVTFVFDASHITFDLTSAPRQHSFYKHFPLTLTGFTALKLPASSGSKPSRSIQGIFNITFKTLEILGVPDAKDPQKVSYILLLYNIGLSFLSFKFPPSGQVNFVLFGNPNSDTDI